MKRVVAVALGFLLSGCSTTGPPVGDTTAPSLVASTPQTGAVGVGGDAVLRLEFSEPLDPESLKLEAKPAVVFAPASWPTPSVAVVDTVSGWPPGAQVSVAISGEDSAGNRLPAPAAVTFTVSAASTTDLEPPDAPTNLVAEPGDGSFMLTWDANLELDLLGYLVFWGSDQEAPTGFQSLAAPKHDFMVSGLVNGATYFVTVFAEDVSGNRSEAATVSVTPSDTTPPSLLASVPADGAADLAAVSVLRLEFSEALKPDSLVLTGCEVGEIGSQAPCGEPLTSLDDPTWSSGDTVAQASVAGVFAAGTSYRLTLAGTDLAGNELPAASQVEFTLAVEVDDTAPYLVSLVTSVDPALHRLRASFRFSEAMDNDSVEAAFGSQPGLACNWSWSAPDVAQCQVNAGLRQNTSYTLVLGVTAADLAGNTLEVPWTAELPVGDLAPRLVSVAPRRDAFNVSVTAPITLTFSEPLDPASLTFVVVNDSNSTVLPGIVEFAQDAESFTYVPAAAYGHSELIFWYVTALTDAGGTPVPAHLSGSFMTRLKVGP